MTQEETLRTGLVTVLAALTDAGDVWPDLFFVENPEQAARQVADAATGEPLGWIPVCEGVEDDEAMQNCETNEMYTFALYRVRQFKAPTPSSAGSGVALRADLAAAWDAILANRNLGVAGAEIQKRTVRDLDRVIEVNQERSVHLPALVIELEYSAGC